MTDQPPQPADPDRLVIRSDDLADDPAPPIQGAAPSVASGGGGFGTPGGSVAPLPPLGAAPPTLQVSASGAAKLGANSVISGLLGGAAGGLVGAIAAEILYSPEDRFATSLSEMRTQAGIWVAIVGAVIGFALLAWDGFTSSAPQKGFRDGAIGAAAGAVAGFIGGYLAQMIFTNILEGINSFDSWEDIKNKYILARMLAWGIFGALLGIGVGIPGGSKKVVNGLIGGALGGAVGGLLFQLIENSNDGGGDATVYRFAGLILTGAGIGLAIGLVERARREAWFQITVGPMAGKEFILYNARTTVGSDFKNNIVLARDATVAPQHVAFERNGNSTVVNAVGGGVFVNGANVNGVRLKNGDQVQVGGSVLTYQERAVS